ncbi:hypothetical protein CEXT_614671 [Caerostris extrusa]|uniref:Uncharacterized protein n=1 Tax=Caerostris extrusa TaxID=172846 RepID=A0AAV4P9V9_CAEEX|nr:hypothetical protein CEXT_614671 [Caerostris extrusa]
MPPPVGDRGGAGAPIANWEQSAPRNTPILTRHYLRERDRGEIRGFYRKSGTECTSTRRFSHATISEKVIKTLLRKFYSLLQCYGVQRRCGGILYSEV